MKKYIFSFLLVSCFLSLGNAHKIEGESHALAVLRDIGARSLQHIPATEVRQYSRGKVAKALREARQISTNIPPKYLLQNASPVSAFVTANPASLEPLYKESSFLTSQQLSNFFTVEENRLYTKGIKYLQTEVWPQIEELLPQLEQQAALLPQPEDPLEFIVQEIPPTIKNFVSAEIHAAQTTYAKIRLLALLRKAYPDKLFIMFTEFLPQNFVWDGQILFTADAFSRFAGFTDNSLIPLWNYANQLGIPVVGLEPIASFSSGGSSFFTRADTDTVNSPGSRSISYSLLGMQYRNEQFVQTLQKVREEYPEAVFFIDIGGNHAFYNTFPPSVSDWLNPTETFVLYLRPSPEQIQQAEGLSSPQLEELFSPLPHIKGGNFPQTFLYFTDPKLIQAAGFNASFQVE